MHKEFDVLNTFIKFKVELDNLLAKHIKTLQLKRGGVSSRLDSFHKEHEIISQLCAPETP